MSVSPKTRFAASSLAALLALPCVVWWGDARAQTASAPGAPAASYPACTSKPTPQDTEAAKSAYMLGKRFFEESDYGSAIHNFADAYKLDCTKPELLLNVARAHELLGNRAEAVRALETYMQRGQNLTPDDKAQLQRRIDNLKAALASQAPVPAPVVTAPQPSQAPQPAASGAPASTLTAPPPPAPAAAGGHTAPPWIVAGVGAAALITGGALYLVGANDVSSATTQCGGSTSSCKAGSAAATQNAINQGNNGDNLEKVGSVVFWVGLAAAGGGVLWHFLEPTGSGSSAPAHALVTPTVGPGYAGGSVVGTF